MTDFGGKTSIFSHPVYLFLREFSLQDSRGGSYTTDYEGFWAYLLTVITDPLRFLAGSRASPGHRSAASTVFSEVCLYR
ncbi:hypothetical protein ACHLD2_004591 [Escherichia coli]